jgi:phage shock protein PspC (stress-responsive transcriptional regulator)
MKKIEKVSIADISFTLDRDAYLSLKQYLDSLHKHYDNDPDGGEITRDIEARIAELILNEQVYTKIVTKQLIDTILAQLGTPQEIEELVTETGHPTVQPTPDSSIPRRLYRSAEGRIFGGVFSGMAHFWDTNVLWFRLIVVSPLILIVLMAPFNMDLFKALANFSLGLMWVFFVVYVVLWMAIPIAKTPRQKLESRGEKITPSSIRQNLQSGATTPSSKKAASVGAEVLAVVGRVVLFLIKLVVYIIAFALLFCALVLFMALIGIPFEAYSDPDLLYLGNAPIMLLITELWIFCIMIPLLLIGLGLLSLVLNWKLGRVFYLVTLGVWFIALVATIVLSITNRYAVKNFVVDVSKQNTSEFITIDYPTSDDSKLLWDFVGIANRDGTEITVTAAGDSVVLTTLREYTVDSLSVDNGTVLKYSKRIVLRDPDAVKEALHELVADTTSYNNQGISIDFNAKYKYSRKRSSEK